MPSTRPSSRKYNEEHGIEPASIIKSIDSDLVKMANLDYLDVPLPGQKSRLDIAGDEDIDKPISRLTKEMKDAAKNLDFERAAEIRGKLRELKRGADLRVAGRGPMEPIGLHRTYGTSWDL